MRKISIFCVTIIILLSVTACSQEFYSGLGSAMGAMSHNIYGIKPDYRKADATASTVISSIERDSNGNVTVNLDKAASIIATMSDIKDSPQKSARLRELLSQKVPEADAPQIRADLISKMEDLNDRLQDAEVAALYSDLKTTLLNAIDGVDESFRINEETRTPEMADIVVVSILNKMADAVMSGELTKEAVSDLGRKAVDTIKVVADISTLDLLADVNATGLVEDLTKDVSRDEQGTSPVVTNLLGKTLSKTVDLISTNRELDPIKYKKFILESKTLKAAYEMTCSKYMPEEKALKNIVELPPYSSDYDTNLTLEDFVMYLILSLNVALEDYTGGLWGRYLADYVFEENNYDIFSDMEHATGSLSNPSGAVVNVVTGIVEESKNNGESINELYDPEGLREKLEHNLEENPDYSLDQLLVDVINEISGTTYADLDEMVEAFTDQLNEAMEMVTTYVQNFMMRVNNYLFTSLAILMDSEYESLLVLLMKPLVKMMSTS